MKTDETGTSEPRGVGDWMSWGSAVALSAVVLLACGCGSPDRGATSSAAPAPEKKAAKTSDQRAPNRTAPPAPPRQSERAPATGAKSDATNPSAGSPPTTSPPPMRRTLADLVPQQPVEDLPPPPLPLPTLDESQLPGLGIQKYAGRHLVLYSDLPATPEITELPAIFDLAVPQWCQYFSIDPQRAKDWKIAGYLIGDRTKFQRAGLMPDNLPEFLNGYNRGAELWLYEQPSAYYRRHLLLHEGTHGFMAWSLRGTGPPWYMEGSAELLATHRWEAGQLTLGIFPASKELVPEWGRIKLIKDGLRAGTAKSLSEIMAYDDRAHLKVEPYAWCWGACAFLDGNPRYRERFRQLKQYAVDRGPGFSERFVGWFREDGHLLWREWQWFVVNAEYGYDLGRESFVTAAAPPRDLPVPTGGSFTVAADRGWQSTGWVLAAGTRYALKAEGRFEVGQAPQPWVSEANGVTLRYVRGLPLGMLMAAVVNETDPLATDNGFLQPVPIGLGSEWTPAVTGTLYLRLNDAPAELADNRGEVRVSVRPL